MAVTLAAPMASLSFLTGRNTAAALSRSGGGGNGSLVLRRHLPRHSGETPSSPPPIPRPPPPPQPRSSPWSPHPSFSPLPPTSVVEQEFFMFQRNLDKLRTRVEDNIRQVNRLEDAKMDELHERLSCILSQHTSEQNPEIRRLKRANMCFKDKLKKLEEEFYVSEKEGEEKEHTSEDESEYLEYPSSEESEYSEDESEEDEQ